MKPRQFKVSGITVVVCKDILWWAKKFYNMPKNSTIANEKQVTSECMGFAQPDGKKIWIFLPERYSYIDLGAVVAHEIGHIVEFKFSGKKLTDEQHEAKADHYMDYFLLVNKIIHKIVHV